MNPDKPLQSDATKYSLLAGYLKEIFNALCHIYEEKSPSNTGINSLVFWQFSRLPKLISDRLFSVFVGPQSSMQLQDFQKCFTLLAEEGLVEEKYQLLYQMADFNEDGVVSMADLRTLVRQSTHVLVEEDRPEVPSASVLEKCVSLETLQSGEYGVWARLIFGFIEAVLDIRGRYTAYLRFINRQHSFQQTKENGLPCQGKMYRLAKGAYLKRYYYKVLGQMLYVYRKKQDLAPKTTLCLTKAVIVRCEPEVAGEDDHKKIYALKIVQPSGKSRIFYFLDLLDREEWRFRLLQAAGQRGEFKDEYEIYEKLGEGLEGQVRRAVHKKTKQAVAVKIMNTVSRDPQLQLQIELGRRLNHSGLIKLIEVFEEPDKCYFVYPYCEGGTLLDYLLSGRPSERIVRGIAAQLVAVLVYLKSSNVVHRDLKPENVLLTGQLIQEEIPEIKLTDLGLSGILAPGETSLKSFGTLLYAAPQILYEQPHDFQADVYSLGVLMYAMCSCKVPFNRKSPQQLVEDVLHKQASFGKGFETISADLVSLIKTMLGKFPLVRPSIEQVEDRLG